MSLFSGLKSLFSVRKRQDGQADEEALLGRLPLSRHALKMLLLADSRFMSQLRDTRAALKGESCFTMVYVRSQCTAMCVCVFAMIRHLQEITARPEEGMLKAFTSIQNRIQSVLAPAPPSPIRELTLPVSSLDRNIASSVGIKMSYLGEIKRQFTDFSVPEGFVITAAAYELFLEHNGLRDEINRRLQKLEVLNTADLFRLSSELQLLIIDAPLPEELQESIHQAYRDLEARVGHRGVRVAVRSSAVGDEGSGSPFSWQYRTELNVSEELLFTAYKEVLASKYSLAAMNYRLIRGLKEEDLPMCVDCMVMVDTRSAGIMYTQDPTSDDVGTIFVNAVHGLAKAISDSQFEPDSWLISKEPELVVKERHIRTKEQRFVSFLSEEGVTLLPTPAAKRDQPSLTDDQAREVGRIGLELERYLGFALSIEWALSKDCRLFVLQCRPLYRTNLDHPPQGPAAPSGEALLEGGQMASPGTAKGRVFIVKDNKDMLFFPEGAVLVTAIPHSRWSAVLPRAAAIVVELRGAIFGHLANISREFGIPALFDLPGAMSILTNGTPVTVDASGGRVLRASEPELEDLPKPARAGFFASTPVHTTLSSMMKEVELITSLAPRPGSEPMSLREISLACRIKGCSQLLKLASSAGATRPLAVKHPADWWVLDLEDPGFGRIHNPEHLDITVHPLLHAMWRGIELARWPAFTNSPRRTSPHRLLRRLAFRLDPLSAPRPRLFLLGKGMAHLHLSLDRGYVSIQAQTGELSELNSIVLIWYWPAISPPAPSLVQCAIDLLADRGFQVDTAVDGITAWNVGCSGEDIAARASFLGFMPQVMLADEHPVSSEVPEAIDLPNAPAQPSSPLKVLS
jgi:pyruvate, water dikinase